MGSMELILAALVFLAILLVFLAAFALFGARRERSIEQTVRRYVAESDAEVDVDLLYYRKLSDIPAFHMLLARIPPVRMLDELLQQGGVRMLAGVFLLLTLTCGMVAYLLGVWRLNQPGLALAPAAAGLALPFVYLLVKRRQHRARFEALFPDALDLMAYSLKAGHSILASLKMVAEEVAAPVGNEFGRVVEEINFGNNIETTLHNFARRLDSSELRYFVASVLIQRETGGNLVELLETISQTIRQKFRFRERVKALIAEGKISAYILVCLPFVIALLFSFLNRKYMMVLMTDPIGPYMIVGALVMMCIGSLIMFRLVRIDL